MRQTQPLDIKSENYLAETSLQKVDLMLTDVVHGTIKIQTFIL